MPIPEFDMPRRATMWHEDSLVLTGNALAYANVSTEPYCGYFYQSVAANGDTWTQGCYLAADSYTLRVCGRTHAYGGKLDVYLDGVLIASGMDWYTVTAGYVVKTIANVVVAFSGWHVVQGVINGRNGSSSGWRFYGIKIVFQPAAD
jgi:hypothetical protein